MLNIKSTIMKKTILLLFALLVINVAVKAQGNYAREEKAVKQAMTNLIDGVSNLDINAVKQNSTSDLLVVEDGKLWNIDTLAIKLVKPAAKFIRTNHLSYVTVKVNGQTAWVCYHNLAHFQFADGKEFDINWLESAVLVNTKNRWLISLLHSTTIK